MEIKITSKQILMGLYILAWIIFIGLGIEAGGILFNTFYTLAINAEGAQNLWKKADLSALYTADQAQFVTISVLMCISAVLKAILFYVIIRTIHNKKIDLSQPFNPAMTRFISLLSWISIGIGIFSLWGSRNTHWMEAKQIAMPDIQLLGFGGADVWFLMGVTLIVIAQIFERGAEIQAENDLTI